MLGSTISLLGVRGLKRALAASTGFFTVLNDFSEDLAGDLRVRDATVYGE